MSNDHPRRETMSLEGATVCNVWDIRRVPRRNGMKEISLPPRVRREEQSHPMKEVRP